MNIIAIVQARLTSSRLPGKVLKKISSYTAIELLYLRLKRSKLISNIVFAVPENKNNAELYDYLKNELKVDVIAGDENDVLGRYVLAAKLFPADKYVRITADCPLICPELIDELIQLSIEKSLDYISNVDPPFYPDGMDTEVFSREALRWLNENIKDVSLREHVTLGLRKLDKTSRSKSELVLGSFIPDRINTAWMRLTLDTPDDLHMFTKLVEHLKNPIQASLEELERNYTVFKLFQLNTHKGFF